MIKILVKTPSLPTANTTFNITRHVTSWPLLLTLDLKTAVIWLHLENRRDAVRQFLGYFRSFRFRFLTLHATDTSGDNASWWLDTREKVSQFTHLYCGREELLR